MACSGVANGAVARITARVIKTARSGRVRSRRIDCAHIGVVTTEERNIKTLIVKNAPLRRTFSQPGFTACTSRARPYALFLRKEEIDNSMIVPRHRGAHSQFAARNQSVLGRLIPVPPCSMDFEPTAGRVVKDFELPLVVGGARTVIAC